MILIGYVLSGLLAAVILFFGARFWLAPAAASAAFGIPDSPPSSTGFTAWLSVKGTRDIVAGLFVLLLLANGAPRLLGQFMLVASLIAFGDMVTVIRSGGSRRAALGTHGLTGLVIVATGVCLIVGAK
jgi:Domain of unknown function (DUF4267)